MRSGGPRTLALITALLLAFTACGDTADPPATTVAPAEPAAAPEPAPTTTPATTPAATPTTEGQAPPTAAPPPAAETPPRIGYRVVGVAADDVLNVRAGPSAGDDIVGSLAPDATGVVVTWQTGPVWWEVLLDDGTTGFVHSGYLALDDAWTAGFDELPCAAPAAGPQRSAAPAGGSNAEHVAGVDLLRSAACDRMVIRLGTGGRDVVGYPSIAADRVPGGVEVAVAGNQVVVTLPAGLNPAHGATEEFGDALLLLAHGDWSAGGRPGPQAHLIYGQPRLAGATFLDDPARIVVDVVPAPRRAAVDLSPHVEAGFVLTEPARWDGRLAGTQPPLTITGFGTAFEASVLLHLTRHDGAPAEATWSGGFDCVGDFGAPVARGDSYCTMTSGDSVWGSFAVTVDDLAPGRYELTIAGECMVDVVGEEACAAAELHYDFVVHGAAATAADSLAPFFAAAERLDRDIAAAARGFNAGYDPDAGTVSTAAQDAIRALSAAGVAGAIPPGLAPDVERAVLAVYADLGSRIAALDGAIRSIPPGSTVLDWTDDMLPCLALGSASNARFDADLARARSLAAGAPAPAAAPDSVAAGVLAVRVQAIDLWNWGCDNCGGATYDETLPVDWEARIVGDGGTFAADLVGGVWEVLINAC